MNLAERFKVMPLLVSANIGISTDCDCICMEELQWIMFLCLCGAFTGDGTFSLKSGLSNGTKTNAVPFFYAMGGAAIGTAVAGSAASADVLGASAYADSGSVVLTCTTKMVVIEVDPADINPGDTWLTLTIAATAGVLEVVAIAKPRYKNNMSVTQLAR